MTSIEEHPSGEPNPLRALTLEQLRRRTSMKWRTYPADVLPLWVAEMDVPLAAPVVRAVTEAVELGALAGPGAAADLARMPEEVGHGPSHVGVLAHTAALRDGTAWLDAVLAGIEENRRLLTRLLAEHLPGVVHRSGEATYLAWLDCRTLGLGDDPADVFLRRGRVALSSGIPFGTGGAGHLRLNLATSAEVITEAVRRMAAALD
ncbi:beta C-S lyase family protein [Streptomyces rochei]|uniref:hypothetical protein n=1 Tax=Streptomyces rochei TaxID=1928 RepID=UPI003692C135